MLKAVFVLSFLISVVAGIIYALRERNGNDIRVVWYLASLTMTIAFGVAWVATRAGAIKDGQFVGTYGAYLNSFIGFMFDIEKDFMIVTGVASLITLPQIVCYVLSGLSGNAKSPVLLNASLSFMVWGLIKSLVVCASMLVSIGVLYLFGYFPQTGRTGWFYIAVGMYTLLLVFGIIFMYREGERLAKALGEHMPFLKAVHLWFTRKEHMSVSKEGGDETVLLQLSKSLLDVTSEIQQILRNDEERRTPGTESSSK